MHRFSVLISALPFVFLNKCYFAGSSKYLKTLSFFPSNGFQIKQQCQGKSTKVPPNRTEWKYYLSDAAIVLTVISWPQGNVGMLPTNLAWQWYTSVIKYVVVSYIKNYRIRTDQSYINEKTKLIAYKERVAIFDKGHLGRNSNSMSGRGYEGLQLLLIPNQWFVLMVLWSGRPMVHKYQEGGWYKNSGLS